MDQYTNSAGADAPATLGQYDWDGRRADAVSAQPPKQVTMLDSVRGQVEHAVERIGGIRHRLEMIGERIVGPSASKDPVRQAGEAIQQSGFIPGTSVALDRLHQEMSRIDDLLSGFETVA